MKKVTRFFSLLLAIAMVLAMNLGTLTVFAGNGGTYTITINGDAEGHTYSAYQIFTGDLSTNQSGGLVLSNIGWGAGIDSTSFLADLTTSTVSVTVADLDTPGSTITTTVGALFASCTTAQEVADVLGKYTDDDSTDLVEAFADIAGDYLGTAAGSSTETSGTTYTITELTAGYYLVQDTADLTGKYDVYTDFILRVVGNVEVTPKSDKPTVDKNVKDTNDTTGDVTDWQKSADYDIGDTIPYQLKATLGDQSYKFLKDYDEYSIKFTDTLCAGLTLDTSSIKVYVDGTEIPATYSGTSTVTNYTVNTSPYSGTNTTYSGGTVLEVSFDDILSLVDENGDPVTVTEGSVITVEYNATLNDDAKIGSTGNPNEVYLEYSNEPNGSGTGKTTTVKAIVFTYKVTVKKTDGTDPLGDAAFELWKVLYEQPTMTGGTAYYLPDGADEDDYKDTTKYTESSTTATSYYYILSDGTNTITYYYDGTTSTYYEVKGTYTADTSTSEFYFEGLDDGKYLLYEITTPTGYNTMSPNPLEFTIASTLEDTDNDGLYELTGITVTDSTGATISGDATSGETFIYDANYNLTTTVVNKSGASMPETGGMGTKIFYTLGGILVVGAGILLIVKRRMKNA